MALSKTLALVALLALLACGAAVEAPPAEGLGTVAVPAGPAEPQGPGFRSQQALEEHYRKHGHEFGSITQTEYLALAQRLRDVEPGGPVLEIVRPVDGVITRFDRRTQHFGAYNPNGVIRTFFIPNDGEAYFRRQAYRRPN